MSMPSTTANWHWKNKNVTSWAQAWFKRELPTILVEEGSEKVAISSVRHVEGDVELGQRKSKLITIYDCKLELDWSGTASDGTEVTGKVSIPEVSHEITLDGLSEYVYEWTLKTGPSPTVDALYAFAKARLPVALQAKFSEFPVAITDTHGKDLTVSGEPSRIGTPAPVPTPSAASRSTTPAVPAPQSAQVKKGVVNTSQIVREAMFMAAAEDLFSLLTDASRIPTWTRAPAESTAQPGTPYSLFGGGVKGEYVSLTLGKEIVQTWVLQSPTWPSDHTATLTTTFEQLSDSTKVVFTLGGVPKGMEDEITRNVEGYYIHGLKSIGYVQLIVSPTYSKTSRATGTRTREIKRSRNINGKSNSTATAVVVAVAILVTAFTLPYVSSMPLYRPSAN